MNIRLVMIAFLFFNHLASAQDKMQNNSTENKSSTTDILLNELASKVSAIQQLKSEMDAHSNYSPSELELKVIQLNEAQKGLIIYIYQSLQERCTMEHRLLDIAERVAPIDAKMADKFRALSRDSLSQN